MSYIYQPHLRQLYSTALTAEKKYTEYMQNILMMPKEKDLKKLLKKAFQIQMGEGGVNTKYFKEQDTIENLFNDNKYDEILDLLANKFQEGPRLQRTTEAIQRLVDNKLKNNETKETILSMIIGNYKEWSFLIQGGMELPKNSKGLLKAYLKDVDNNKMDFVIEQEGSDKNQYNKRGSYKYLLSGVPLEYKKQMADSFHLTDKTVYKPIISSLATQHIINASKGVNLDTMIDKFEIDLCCYVIESKINEGFPVFVTSRGGTNGQSYFLCSELLNSITSIAGLHTHILDLPQTTLNTDIYRTMDVEQIKKLIMEDKRACEELKHIIQSIAEQREDGDIEEGLNDEPYKQQLQALEKKTIADYLKRKTLSTSL